MTIYEKLRKRLANTPATQPTRGLKDRQIKRMDDEYAMAECRKVKDVLRRDFAVQPDLWNHDQTSKLIGASIMNAVSRSLQL